MGLQLYAHSWGLIVPFRGKAQHKAEKSFGNSQILPRDYARRDQIELVLKELTEQVAARLRKAHCQTECITVYVGYSKGQIDREGRTGWRKQQTIPATKTIQSFDYLCITLREHYLAEPMSGN